MNLDDNYFHFLNGSTLNEEIIEICLERLELIIKTGFILSRNRQIEVLGDYQQGVSEVNWNGFDNVSICIKTNHNQYNIAFKEYTDDVLNAFELFSVDNSVCIILRNDLLNYKDVSINKPIYYLPGEFQVKNQTPLKYFYGIGVKVNDFDLLETDYELIRRIYFILKRYNIELPIINIKNNEKIYSYKKRGLNI